MAENDLKIADCLNKESAYDNECKNILSNKQILANILKECIDDYKDMSIDDICKCIEKQPQVNCKSQHDTIEGKNVEDGSIAGAMIRYDVLFEAALPKNKNEEIGVIINIEAQNKDNPSYPLISRALYYCSRLISRQKNAPDGFQKSEFGKLKKVYSIWLCFNHNQEKDNVVNRYRIKEECMNRTWYAERKEYDLIESIMIYPAKKYDYNKKGLLEFINLLFNSKLDGNEKKYYLVNNYNITMTRELDEEMIKMCNLSQGIKEEGHAEGRAEGLAKGLAEGRAEEKINSAKKHIKNLMKTKNVTLDEAVDILGIEKEIVEILRKEIE